MMILTAVLYLVLSLALHDKLLGRFCGLDLSEQKPIPLAFSAFGLIPIFLVDEVQLALLSLIGMFVLRLFGTIVAIKNEGELDGQTTIGALLGELSILLVFLLITVPLGMLFSLFFR